MGRPKKNDGVIAIKGLSAKAIQRAKLTHKLLPHELLLLWANGIEVANLRPTEAQQLYAAVAAAPYYAPRLANVEVKQDVRVRAVISAQPMTQDQWARKYLNAQENPTAIEPENYFTTGKNIEGEGSIPQGMVSPQPVHGLLGEIASVGIDNVLAGVPIGAQHAEIVGNSEAAGLKSETNRKRDDDTYIPPSTADAVLDSLSNNVLEVDDDTL